MADKPLEAIFKPAMILMSGRVFGFIATFIIPLILVRIFDQHEFGTYKQLFLIYGTLFVICQAGMAESLYYFLPAAGKRSGGYVLNTLLSLGLLGFVSVGLLWLLRGFAANALNNPDLGPHLPYIGIYLFFMLMAVVLEIVMTVRKRHKDASFAYGVSDLGRALLFILPVLVFASLEWLLIGAICFAAIRCAVMFWFVRREFSHQLRPRPALLSGHLAYALPFGLSGLIEIVQKSYHMYAVSYSFDAATFAIYAVGCLQIPLFDFLITSTSNVMMVNMGEKRAEQNYKAVAAIWLDTTRKLSMVFCPLVVGLVIMSHELIILMYTSDYADSVPIFMIWTGAMLFATFLTDGVLRVFAQTRFLIFQNFIKLAITASLIPFFIGRFGIIGAIMVSVLAMVITRTMALARIKSIMQVSLTGLLPWASLSRSLLTAVAAALPVLFIKMTLDIALFPLLMIMGVVFWTSYYLLLLWLGPLEDEEKQMLVQWVRFPAVWLNRAWKS